MSKVERPGRSRVALMVLVLAGASVPLARSQDSNQAMLQYGPQGTLLDGASIGGVQDLSAAYYNPGALVLLPSPRFTASLVCASWDRLEIRGDDESLDVQPVSVHPNLVAGSLDHTGRVALSWAFLMRHQLDYDLALSEVSVGADAQVGEFSYGRRRQRIREYWGGTTLSLKLGARSGVGISGFVAYRLQRLRRAGLRDTAGPAGVDAVTSILEQELDHVRVQTKVGWAWRPGSLDLGLTLTPPGLGLWSTGRVRSVSSASGSVADHLGAVDQDGLDATYRAPWSVGAGGTWRGRRTRVHASTEAFSKVATEPILSAGSASLVGGKRGVVWFAAAVERDLSASTTICLSASRDPSSGVAGTDVLSTVDLTSVGAGILFPFRRSRIGVGVRLSQGEGPGPTVPVVPGRATGSTASFHRVTLSFGSASRVEP